MRGLSQRRWRGAWTLTFLSGILRAILCTCLLLPTLGAAQEVEERPLEVRISSLTNTLVYIDHGQDAGLAQGDRVVVYPDGAPSVEAVVRSVTRNNARIELFEPVEDLVLGTRCDVFLKPADPQEPVSGGGDPLPPATVRPGQEPEAGRVVPDHPAWTRPPEDWKPGGALLAEASPIGAADRPLDWNAHWTLSGSLTQSHLAGKRQSFSTRGNFGWQARNAFGKGGEFEFDASAYTRASDSVDGFEEQHSRLRLNHLSYLLGGRRGEPTRYEFGRFVQHEMPEFGRLDGVEVGHRLESGRLVGVSAGHLPEPSDSLGAGDDWQLAFNLSDGLSDARGVDWRTAYQKTWHRGHADRDLFLLGSRWSPGLGDTVSATAWVDWYSNEDGPKQEGLEWTRLRLFASHATSPGSGLRFSHSRSRTPYLLRQQFDTPAEDLDLSAVVQRTSISHWRRLDHDRHLRTRLEYWQDDRDDGLQAECGHEWSGLLPNDTDLEATLFGTDGSFSKLVGLRLGLRTLHAGSYWNLSWQSSRLTESTLVGAGDTLWQHDLRAGLNRRIFEDWNLSLSLDLGLGEDQDNRRLGFHIGRRF